MRDKAKHKQWYIDNAEQQKAYRLAKKAERNAYSKDYNEKNKLIQKEKRLVKVYGLNFQQINEKLVSQEFKCEICRKDIDEQTLHIDHCHETNDNRGLLCVNCNTGLGQFKDNIEFLNNAAKYLTKYKKDKNLA